MTPALSTKLALEVEQYAANIGITTNEYLERFGHWIEKEYPRLLPQNEWEAAIQSIGSPIGANISDEDLSSEALYD